MSENLPTAFRGFLQACHAGEGAEKKEAERRIKAEGSVSSKPFVACDGWDLEALAGRADVSAGWTALHPAAPATATDTP